VEPEAETARRLLGERTDRAALDRLLLKQALLSRAADAATATALLAAVEDALESAHAARWQVTRSERNAVELVEHIWPSRPMTRRHKLRQRFAETASSRRSRTAGRKRSSRSKRLPSSRIRTSSSSRARQAPRQPTGTRVVMSDARQSDARCSTTT
jgi:hypothetical protein